MTTERPEKTRKSRPPFQYRLKTLLLLPVLIALLGALGIWVGWGAVLVSTPILLGLVPVRSGKVTVIESFVIVVVLYVLFASVLPAFESW